MFELLEGPFVTKISHFCLSAYTDAIARSAILLLAAWLVTMALRKRAAATRHLVWTLALFAVVLLPLLSAVLPAWRALPGWATTETGILVPLSVDVTSDAQLPPSETGVTFERLAPQDFALTDNPPATMVTAGHRSTRGPSRIAVPTTLMLLWVFGALATLTPVLAGVFALARLSRRARTVADGPWVEALEVAMAQMNLRRPVSLLDGGEKSMPTVWGVFRTRLLVPAEGLSWTRERRLVVLLHELAHVKRRDCLTRMVARLACSAYWFNPLVWFAWRRLQAESERACDDLVLAGGGSAADYAGHILAIVSGVRRARFANHAAIAMARRSGLEGRLVSILDETRSRSGLTRAALTVAVILAAVVVTPVAITKAATEPAAPAAAAKATKVTPEDLAKAVENGTLKRFVTTPDQFKELYGKPRSENSENKGGEVEVAFLGYDGFAAAFQRFHANEPFGLFALNFGRGWRELGAKGLLGGDEPAQAPDNVRKAIDDGTLKRFVTTVDEFKERFGKPRREATEQKGGGAEVLFLTYNDFYAAFQKDRANDPFRLYALNFGEGWRELGYKGLRGDQPAVVPDNLLKAIEDGTLRRGVTTFDEFNERFGKPLREVAPQRGGGVEVLFAAYSDFSAFFQKDSASDQFRLFAFNFGEGWRDLGDKRLLDVERPKEVKSAGETADNEKNSSTTAAAVKKAIADGTLKSLETTPDEFRKLFGKPAMEKTEDKRGTAQTLFLAYDGVIAAFAGDSSTKEPFRLFAFDFGEGWRQLGDKSLEQDAERNFMTVRPIDSVDEFADVRFKDMSKLDLSGRVGLPETLQFNEATVWPPSEKLPPGCDPKAIVDKGKNPGLGVRDLHKDGITGKGVNVAIIDQPLYQDHPEFAGKIAAYYDAGCGGSQSSMHGPSVTSLLVGTDCGTAPGATLYYAAAPSWKADAEYYAKALDWIIEQNEKLPAGEKIRVVSVSAAPSGPGSPFTKNNQMWDEACERAEKAGILVLTCEQTRGFIGPCWYDAGDPENTAKCQPGFAGRETGVLFGYILAPCSVRTTAEEYLEGQCSYAYWGQAGLSWAIPYATGVMAMGWQVRPDLSGEWMKYLLYDSAYVTKDGARIINPKEYIRRVKEAKVEAGQAPPPMPKREVRESAGSLKTVRPMTSVKTKDDVRWKDLSKLDLSDGTVLMRTLWFNEKTVWPPADKLPAGFDPKALLDKAKRPPLGVKDLHREGITGKGVAIAVFGQPALGDHPEFAGKMTEYHDMGCQSDTSMVGPTVLSLAIGANCGTAPAAKVYFVAVPVWKRDATYSAQALDWIVERNKTLTGPERIRLVADAQAPTGEWPNRDVWDEARKRAEAAGILVVTGAYAGGFVAACGYDLDNSDDVSKCNLGSGDTPPQPADKALFVPALGRTAAEEYDKGDYGYHYFGLGGPVAAVPYAAGVLALGWQVKPELSADQMKELLVESCYVTADGWKVINPKEFIRLVREAKAADPARK